MTWQTVRSGFTGPSDKIGGSSPYHIDWKIRADLPIAEKVKAFDSVAAQYKSIGRIPEFSNGPVSGQRWDTSLPFDDKVQLLNRVIGAHAPREGWSSIDAYVPFINSKNRFEKGAVEGASIFLPVKPGQKVVRNTAPGYGFYSTVLDSQGNPVVKVGHGDVSRPEQGPNEFVFQSQASGQNQSLSVNPPQQPQTAQQPPVTNINLDLSGLLGLKKKEEQKKVDPIQSIMDSLLAQAMNQALTPQETTNYWNLG